MNILVTTLGYSWHIIPEILGFTNPKQFDLYQTCPEIKKKQIEMGLLPADECWIVTIDDTQGMREDIESLYMWAKHFGFIIRIISCSGVKDFSNEHDIKTMRSCIFRTVLLASEKTRKGKLYLSLAGGRKTMSADMQEAANLFGCDLLLHVIDSKPIPKTLREEPRTSMMYNFLQFGSYFLPVIIKEHTPKNPILNTGTINITSRNFPLRLPSTSQPGKHEEDQSLLKIIEARKTEANLLYTNFLGSIESQQFMKRDGFRKFYLLDSQSIHALQTLTIGNNADQDIELIKKLPKCDLHSHLGGVLSPQNILNCVSGEKSFILSLLGDPDHRNWHSYVSRLAEMHDFTKLINIKESIGSTSRKQSFIRNVLFISALSHHPGLFKKIAEEPFKDEKSYVGIGIEAYQKLGDFQGSRLLQTPGLIQRVCRIYAESLSEDGVEYFEIRCSPYKYCEFGLSVHEVINCIIDEMDKSGIPYRIIIVFGRTASSEEITDRISELLDLYKTNARFAEKFVGVDLAGTEGAQSPSELRECFLPLLQECIHITIHAGETESVENIWEAVYYLAADRIGHGLRLLERPELLVRFVDKNIGIEMCPSSNHQIIGYNQGYPLKEYMKRGLKVTVNTDNCGISRTTMSKEFHTAGKLSSGMSLWDCIVLIRNSLSIAFLDAETKKQLMIEYEMKIMNLIQTGALI